MASNTDNPQEVQNLLSQSNRDPNTASTGGRRLVLDPTTGKLVVKSANETHEGVPLQSVGGWA